MSAASFHQPGRRRRGLTAALAVVAVGAMVVIGPSVGARGGPPHGGNPPGANGTIKIDGQPFEDPPRPNNEPHVGCIFNVDFAGFDEGNYFADVLFEAQPPTGRGELLTDRVFIGEDPAGGAVDHDASATYDLSGPLASFTPHPQQGYHVKVTVRAEGAGGKIATKHKVFWVQDCEPPNEEECPPGFELVVGVGCVPKTGS
ncbi:hypothetical protein BH23ACT2_BH23ACT2_20030 [soil metagenome]